MSAYLIYICQSVEDREALETYWRESPATYVGHEVKTMAVYTPFELLEGDGPVEGVVMAEFPSMEAARKWFHSPAYTKVRKHREKGAKYLGLLVEAGRVAELKDRMPNA